LIQDDALWRGRRREYKYVVRLPADRSRAGGKTCARDPGQPIGFVPATV
jgi:hypothetical protein